MFGCFGAKSNRLLAFLGLILAFTFSASVRRNDMRKQVLIQEAIAIDMAFLRADLVTAPENNQIQKMLLSYARTRIAPNKGSFTLEQQAELLQASNEVITELWSITMAAISRQDRPAAVQMALVGAINEVIDQGAIRNAAIQDRLPGAIL